jgi:Protein of unknown function (DUF1569)
MRRRALIVVAAAAPLAQMLNHAAQSIDYSIDGFPELQSKLFRAVVGSVAFTVFQARGKMSHSLVEPIPGAPALDDKAPLEPAIAACWPRRAASKRTTALSHRISPMASSTSRSTRART